MTQAEKEAIIRGKELFDSSANDKGELVFKGFRMCGFVPVNIPILCGMLLTKPTMFNTVLWQWINQSYNAGLNYGNKNSSCSYTNKDLLMGYLAAVGSAIIVSSTLRKVLSPFTKGATGTKFLLLNTLVAAGGSGSANFCNTTFMRMAETEKGIDVYSDEKLT